MIRDDVVKAGMWRRWYVWITPHKSQEDNWDWTQWTKKNGVSPAIRKNRHIEEANDNSLPGSDSQGYNPNIGSSLGSQAMRCSAQLHCPTRIAQQLGERPVDLEDRCHSRACNPLHGRPHPCGTDTPQHWIGKGSQTKLHGSWVWLSRPQGACKIRQKAVKGIYKMKVIFKTSRNRTPYDHLQQKYPTEVILVIRQIVGNWRLSYELHQLHPIV